MNNISWFDRISKNFDEVVERFANSEFAALYYGEECIVVFTEYDKDRVIEFELAEPDTPKNILKYHETESYFYTEYEDTMYDCDDNACGSPAIKKRIILDNTEALMGYIENEIMIDVSNLGLSEALSEIIAGNVVNINERNKER